VNIFFINSLPDTEHTDQKQFSIRLKFVTTHLRTMYLSINYTNTV